MRMRPQTAVAMTMVALTIWWPASASAKRGAPDPVSPITWQGVEYRAPMGVEHMGHVQAFDASTGHALWDTKVYHVWINPLMEEDVQWVFISGMTVRDNQLVVSNEAGKTFNMDLRTGRVENRWFVWSLLFLAGCIAPGAALLARLRKGHGPQACPAGTA